MIYLLILIGFCLLIYGGNLLVDGSVAVAKRMHVSSLLIGLTLVGFGTSTPELMTSLLASFQNSEGIAVGNVVGSNIANILLILGMALAIHAIPIHRAAFKRDGMFLSISTGVLCVALLIGKINFIMGALMCATLIYYIYYSYKTDKQHQHEEEKEVPVVKKSQRTHQRELGISIAKAIIGIVLTIVGAKVLVTNSVLLANKWGISESIIGLTIVAVGTSLPELVTSVVAALKKQGALALGNVIGSNIYNALFILGFTALITPIKVPKDITLDVGIMAAVTALLLVCGHGHKMKRPVGFLFLGLYVVYISYLIGNT